MTRGDWLAHATQLLHSAGIETARLDSLVLLADAGQNNKATVLASLEVILTDAQLQVLNQALARRQHHEPLAYIRGLAEFFGRRFLITPAVLVPRPETESIIELLLDIPDVRQAALTVADIGCGSGCIGLTAALELPKSTVTLSDLSHGALEIAEQNRQALTVSNATVQRSDLCEALPDATDIILANLPYVPDAYPVNQAAEHEPPSALFSGQDGLEHYRRFWKQLADKPGRPVAYVVVESLPVQHKAMAVLADEAGYKLTVQQDFIQQFEWD